MEGFSKRNQTKFCGVKRQPPHPIDLRKRLTKEKKENLPSIETV